MKARERALLHSRGLSDHIGRREKAEALVHSSRAGFIDPCYPADNKSGAECEREKEEERSQQQHRVPQLT